MGTTMAVFSTGVMLFVMSHVIAIANASPEEKELIRMLLNRAAPLARPVLHPHDQVHITLRLIIANIVALNEIEEEIVLKMNYHMRWSAPTLVWKPGEHGNVTSIHLNPDRLWTPDLVVQVSTRKDRKRSPTAGLLAKTPLVLYPNGTIDWKSPTMTQTACHTDPTYFPFDRHLCYMNFSLWSHPVRLATLSPGHDPAVLIKDTDHGIWNPTVLPMKKEEVFDTMHDESCHQLVVGIYLERAPFFYVYNIMYPGAVLLLVTLIGFYIPNTGGNKITFGVSIMVSIVMFQQYLQKLTVRSSFAIPILGEFFGAGEALSFLFIVLSVIALRLVFYSRTDPKHLPNESMMRFLGKITRMQARVVDILAAYHKVQPKTNHLEMISVLRKRRLEGAPIAKKNEPRLRCRATRIFSGQVEEKPVHALENIVSEVMELRQQLESEMRQEDEEGDCTGAWELLADMTQRLALFLSAIALIFACLGIFVQLAFRPPLYETEQG